MKKTLVIRLSGTNSDLGKQKLNDFTKLNPNYKFITGDNMDDAAKKAVATIKKWSNLTIKWRNLIKSIKIFFK